MQADSPQDLPGTWATHPFQRRFLVEDLLRRRSAQEGRRYAASQRRGRIDPNPHQIEAVMFALGRLQEGGCLLADEVGLGKTIEAGLIVAQMLAEGAHRVLIIVPKPLLGQWADELLKLFGVETREVENDPASIEGPGVFLIGREFAGGEVGSSLINSSDGFGLCVVDEAHEIFANVFKRFAADGAYKEDSKDARMAHRLRNFLRRTPLLLLTATPLQNSLTEMWGLVHYIEPTGTLLGDLPTFRSLFCSGDDRTLNAGQAEELRRRLSLVCQRTLRRQAQPFLEKPFVGRRARLFEYDMLPDERALYNDVTEYLLDPAVCAIESRSRHLWLIGFHRRMASSIAALIDSLKKLVLRLEKKLESALEGAPDLDDDDTFLATLNAADLEGEGFTPLTAVDEVDELPTRTHTPDALREEIARIRSYVARAEALPRDNKAQAFLEAVRYVVEQKGGGEGAGRVVVFTESLTTQGALRDLLVSEGFADTDITLFRGQNHDARARDALARWTAKVAHTPGLKLATPSIAMRQALVDEFENQSRVFISTEAGAKGLNLQFCDTVINYDLPWNPQRIEQRIGRCHRYGQSRDVTVINFLARDNETQRLLFEILSQKLDLFGEVLDASDTVLHHSDGQSTDTLASALGAGFEARLQKIYRQARSVEHIAAELSALRESMDDERAEFERVAERTTGLIQSRLDAQIQQVFSNIQSTLPANLVALDLALEEVLVAYLRAHDVPFDSRRDGKRTLLSIPDCSRLPLAQDGPLELAIGHVARKEELEPVHLGHPLILDARREAIDAAAKGGGGSMLLTLGLAAQGALAGLDGARGRLALVQVDHRGFESVQSLHLVAVAEGREGPMSLSDEQARLLLGQRMVEHDAAAQAGKKTQGRNGDALAEALDEAIDERVFVNQSAVAEASEVRFRQLLHQIERFMDDRIMVVENDLRELEGKHAEAQRAVEGALGADARERARRALLGLETKLEARRETAERLRNRDDAEYQKWRAQAYGRRYLRPEVSKLFEFEFLLVNDPEGA